VRTFSAWAILFVFSPLVIMIMLFAGIYWWFAGEEDGPQINW